MNYKSEILVICGIVTRPSAPFVSSVLTLKLRGVRFYYLVQKYSHRYLKIDAALIWKSQSCFYPNG